MAAVKPDEESNNLSEYSNSTSSYSHLHGTQSEDDDENLLNRRFRTVMNKCLEKIMASGRQEKLNSCFANMHKQNPDFFQKITEQFMQSLRSNIEKEIELMIKQEDLEFLFSKLSHVMLESQNNPEPAWRPSGDPSEDTRNHIMAVKMKYKEQLAAMLQRIEEENKSLTEEVLQRREKFLVTEKNIVSSSHNLTEVAEFCTNLNMESLNEELVDLKGK